MLDEEKVEAAKLYEAGCTLEQLAVRFKTSASTVRVVLADEGVLRRNPGVAVGTTRPSRRLPSRKELYELYRGGCSCRGLADIYGVTKQAVWKEITRYRREQSHEADAGGAVGNKNEAEGHGTEAQGRKETPTEVGVGGGT
jgi:hypothetical protein